MNALELTMEILCSPNLVPGRKHNKSLQNGPGNKPYQHMHDNQRELLDGHSGSLTRAAATIEHVSLKLLQSCHTPSPALSSLLLASSPCAA
jgi:hypothetical protein